MKKVSLNFAFFAVVMTYLWAVVQHLYKKMESRQNDHKLLIEEPDYDKSSQFAVE